VTLRRLGDALLTTPLIRSIRRAWPDAAIDVLAFGGSAGILRGNPDVDNIITMRSGSSALHSLRLIARLWRRYDLAVSTQPGDRPTFFTRAAGRKAVGLTETRADGFIRRIKRRVLDLSTADARDVHRVEVMLRLADLLQIERVPEVVAPAAAAAAALPDRPYAVIHAAPMFRYKQWTHEGWRALTHGLAQRGLSIVAISGPDPAERRYLDEIWQGTVNARTSDWPETTALLQNAKAYIGPDTSVSHLAAATGCPTIALFGPMDPRIWGPWPVGGLERPWDISGTIQNRGNVWLVQNPLPCMPCTFEGCERHIDSTSVCLEELTASQVLAAVDSALAAPRAA
jgi:heptosyltransferase III